jgi:nucleoid-associated protein YgaU
VQILRGDNARLAAQVGVRPATGAAPVVRVPAAVPVAFVTPGRSAPSRPGAVVFAPPPPAVPAPAAPALTPPAAGPRTHIVAPGETLSGISLRYYGSARRWAEIFEANLDTVRAPHLLRAGQRLRIP